jgi:hypothetical protein
MADYKLKIDDEPVHNVETGVGCRERERTVAFSFQEISELRFDKYGGGRGKDSPNETQTATFVAAAVPV